MRKSKALIKLQVVPEQLSIVDKILNFYKGTELHLTEEEDSVRVRIDAADRLLRQHNYDKELVRGMMVQQYDCSHESAKNYMKYAEIIHAAFLEINIHYERLWLHAQLKKRIATADPNDKAYSKLVHASRELMTDIEKQQAQQPRKESEVHVTIKYDPSLLGLPEDFDIEDEERRINELRIAAKRKISGNIEDVEHEDVTAK